MPGMTMPAASPLPIENYALIGDCTTSALVGIDGSIDWLCWPRFDSGACFAALLGTADHGGWKITPREEVVSVTRGYRDETMILETNFETRDGRVALIDFMPIDAAASSIVRLVRGQRGKVTLAMNLSLRFDYGMSVPWVTSLEDGSGIQAVAGANLVVLRSPVKLEGEDLSTSAEFTVGEGEAMVFVLSYGASHLPPPEPFDPAEALFRAESFWHEWSQKSTYRGPWRAMVQRSMLTLKALTFRATGGLVAAPTTSLPEQLGGTRNWDYRYCWLRDATLTLMALMSGGYFEEAQAWRDWLHRSIAGAPEQLQILYGIAGERHQLEWEVPWLPGYGGAKPVRIGNAAVNQLQLDVFGEVMGALHQAREYGLAAPPSAWSLQRTLIDHLENIWRQPDEGIWEVRSGRRHFTFSKVMAWSAMARSIEDAEKFNLDAPLDRWRQVKDEMHQTICREGYDAGQQSFVQSFGGTELDASLLLLPIVGFLPAEDSRVQGTLAAIERNLLVDGFVSRYRTENVKDGLPPGEGVFLPCNFWLVRAYTLQGRHDEAAALFERLVGLCNDVGLLSEEYDPTAKRLVGNFPQAFSHVSLIGAALSLHYRDDPVVKAAKEARTAA